MNDGLERVRFPQTPVLSDEEVRELAARIRAGDDKAREELVSRNLRLVMSIVNRFLQRTDDSEDLFQVGCVGLLRAADRFDASVGTRFSTYAVPVILGEIRRHLRSAGGMKIGRTLRERAVKVEMAREQLRATCGREPTVEEVASATGLAREEVVETQEAFQPVASLSEPSSGECPAPFEEQLAVGESFADKSVESIALQQAMTRLSASERAVLQLRFFRELTQVEVARALGISQPQVSKIEQKALRRLRQELV
ncbi:MAG: sigma-70 family RNA polymerase sigma factor [Firmicutes bacterium]|jgi:RNA polymerase sporulation-specific sigma factor|nr:sigma-70 family RNA polymerase sigma factor [Bacillota bacterium]MDH7495533.1 sigma-70 family RNA polymerase sigma factor [Bacillota bacterium]